MRLSPLGSELILMYIVGVTTRRVVMGLGFILLIVGLSLKKWD
jgi:hypothetical protein